MYIARVVEVPKVEISRTQRNMYFFEVCTERISTCINIICVCIIQTSFVSHTPWMFANMHTCIYDKHVRCYERPTQAKLVEAAIIHNLAAFSVERTCDRQRCSPVAMGQRLLNPCECGAGSQPQRSSTSDRPTNEFDEKTLNRETHDKTAILGP